MTQTALALLPDEPVDAGSDRARHASKVRSSPLRNGVPIEKAISTIMTVRRQEEQFHSGILDQFPRRIQTRRIVGDEVIVCRHKWRPAETYQVPTINLEPRFVNRDRLGSSWRRFSASWSEPR